MKRRRLVENTADALSARSTKNIVKNYGKAICAFASSKLALPYLEDLLKELKLNYPAFVQFSIKKKDSIDSIENFKLVFMVEKNDSPQEKNFKYVLKKMGEIFIKYFSVNWIYNGKMMYKEAHLRFRFKMLRRVQNPERFTFLKPHRYKK